MKKSQLFDLICRITCDVCEVRPDSLLNSKCRLMSVVDARCMAVVYLHKAGLSDDDIAFLALRRDLRIEWPDWSDIERKSRSYESIRKTFEDRCNQSFAFREMVKLMQERWEDMLSQKVMMHKFSETALLLRNEID